MLPPLGEISTFGENGLLVGTGGVVCGERRGRGDGPWDEGDGDGSVGSGSEGISDGTGPLDAGVASGASPPPVQPAAANAATSTATHTRNRLTPRTGPSIGPGRELLERGLGGAARRMQAHDAGTDATNRRGG